MAKDTKNQTTNQGNTGEEIVRITVILPAALHKSFKIYSATTGKTIQDITEAALTEYMAAHPAGDIDSTSAFKTEQTLRDLKRGMPSINDPVKAPHFEA